jgi:hypothetical protein
MGLGAASFSRTYGKLCPRFDYITLTTAAAPPECWRNEDRYLQGCDIPVTQTVDIWPLGCIFIEAMVWVAHGWYGLETFRQERLNATNKIKRFKDGNCFHDGKVRLPVVDEWLNRAINEGPKTDHVSPLLVHLVKEMVDGDANRRPLCPVLRHGTEHLLEEVYTMHPGLQDRDVNSPLPLPESPWGQPPTNPKLMRSVSQSQSSSNFQSPNSSSPFFTRDLTPPSSPPISPSTGDGSDWRSTRNLGYLGSTEKQETRSFIQDSPSPQDPRAKQRPGDNANLAGHLDGRNLHSSSKKRNSNSHSQPRLNSIGRLSFVCDAPTQRTSIALGSVIENAPTKPKNEVPVWSISEAFAWKEQRKEPKKLSLSHIERYIGKESVKSKFANITGSDHLLELRDRDHVSFEKFFLCLKSR